MMSLTSNQGIAGQELKQNDVYLGRDFANVIVETGLGYLSPLDCAYAYRDVIVECIDLRTKKTISWFFESGLSACAGPDLVSRVEAFREYLIEAQRHLRAGVVAGDAVLDVAVPTTKPDAGT